ncbi:MAG TPA: alkaline phosphatase family protein [Methanocella sp.]|nr:alkaline phosphatase family protein [Methanocella sp.]
MRNYMVAMAIAVFLIIFSVMALYGCMDSSRQWSMTLQGNHTVTINRSVYDGLVNCNSTINNVTGVPLEIFLYSNGLYPVTSITADGKGHDWRGEAYSADWDMPFLVLPNGSLYDGSSVCTVGQINVTTVGKPAHSSLELPPSLMYALAGEGSKGLIPDNASQVVVYYIDGFGYNRYQSAKANGTINNITALGDPIVATSVYPSVSRVNSRALVTGMPPNFTRGGLESRIPDSPTIFDRLHADGKSGVWIDSISAPVFLGDYILYQRDTNHDGHSDEIVAEAIRQYRGGTNLVLVHFKDTDLKAHAYGPYSPQAIDAVKGTDARIGQIDSVLKPGTVVVVYADHGFHDTFYGGNHGTLLPDDTIVPLIIHRM